LIFGGVTSCSVISSERRPWRVVRRVPACFLIAFLIQAMTGTAASPEAVERARALYNRTEYHASLALLEKAPATDGAAYELIGKNYFALEDYERAVLFFEKACAAEPKVSDYYLWLGRAWGRRAETAGIFAAPARALKARQNFEMAVMLDPKNTEALNDLFDFYLSAPNFIGGGVEKAEAIAHRIEHERPAEYQHELALLAEHRKQHEAALEHLRKAAELAPEQPGRMLDIARFLARLGRPDESEAMFRETEGKWPGLPEVAFAHAKFYVDTHREPQHARQLLEGYLKADITPDDPPKSQAEKLLRQVTNR
jgi:tetratricopeptide (TPR) repeat protein